MSLLLWTARSISPRSSASSISLTNSRLPPTSESGASCSRSPDVLMTTMRHGGPPARRDARRDRVGLPQRELAAARAESELCASSGQRASAARRRRAERLDALALRRRLDLAGRSVGCSARPNSRVSASVYAPTVSASPSALSCSVGVSSSFSTMRCVISSTRARALRAAAPTA